jgi:hypothetical protein
MAMDRNRKGEEKAGGGTHDDAKRTGNSDFAA